MQFIFPLPKGAIKPIHLQEKRRSMIIIAVGFGGVNCDPFIVSEKVDDLMSLQREVDPSNAVGALQFIVNAFHCKKGEVNEILVIEGDTLIYSYEITNVDDEEVFG
jgi:hypothetical protein